MAQVYLGIDVETSDVVQADAQLDNFESGLRGVATTFNAVTGASQKADRGVRGFADATQAARQQTAQMTNNVVRLAGNSGFGAMRMGMQNASFQLQDIVVQMQMGTSAARALSIQLPQLLGGFGALGAAVGLVAGISLPFFAEQVDHIIAVTKEWAKTSEILGALGDALNFLGENIQRLVSYAVAAAAFFAGKWAVALAMATARAIALNGALNVLKATLLRLGFTALIVAVGELIYQFTELVRSTGGVGEAFKLLGEVAAGVWRGIVTSASAIPPGLGAVWATIRADFLELIAYLTAKWQQMLSVFQGSVMTAADAVSSPEVQGLVKDIADAKEQAAALGTEAKTRMTAGFKEAGAALAKLRGHADGAAWALGGKGAAGAGGGGGGGAAGAAKDLGKELSRIVKPSERFTKELERQKQLSDQLVTTLRGLAFGTITGAEGIGGIIGTLTDSSFGDTINEAFKKAGDTLADVFSKAMNNLGGAGGLGSFATASIGTGIGIAATGALTGNAQQIGSGIGSAIGGSIGSAIGGVAGPIGMVLGGIAGGFISKLFGGDDKWQSANVTAFEGTSYSQNVSARFNTENEGATPNARAAVIATEKILKNFNVELREYVQSVGGTVQTGTRFVVSQQRALKAITGFASDWDAPRAADGNAEQVAADIANKVAAVMALAGELAQKAGPELTKAQVAWREAQKKFSAENLQILKSLGFTAEQFYTAQADIKKNLGQSFNKELLDTIVDGGRATRAELDKWKSYELATLAERRRAALNTAREIGSSVTLVASAFRTERRDIESEWQDMLAELTGGVVDAKDRIRQAQGLNKSMVDTLVESGRATKTNIDQWKGYEILALRERTYAALKSAKELGASTNLIRHAFNAQKAEIVEKWRELLRGLAGEVTKVAAASRMERLSFNQEQLRAQVDIMGYRANPADIKRLAYFEKEIIEERRKVALAEARRLHQSISAVNKRYNWELVQIEWQKGDMLTAAARRAAERQVDIITETLSRLQDSLSIMEGRRSDVLQELTRRSEDARRAEQALAEARGSLAGGDLNPGGPMDRFRALQRQFGAAIGAAGRGDADAASQAASLAQNLLQAGRGIYASGTEYADLFRQVNTQLRAAQMGARGAAREIDRSTATMRVVEATEQSTRALLLALGRLNTSITNVEKRIAAQTKSLEAAQQKSRVA